LAKDGLEITFAVEEIVTKLCDILSKTIPSKVLSPSFSSFVTPII